MYEHKQGFIKNSFSSRYKLYKLVWFEEFTSPFEAIHAEKKVKDFRREKKITLIKAINLAFKDLNSLR
jgi:putative endonuclease